MDVAMMYGEPTPTITTSCQRKGPQRDTQFTFCDGWPGKSRKEWQPYFLPKVKASFKIMSKVDPKLRLRRE